MAFSKSEKRCKYVHRMDQGLRSEPHWDELIDLVPNMEKQMLRNYSLESK